MEQSNRRRGGSFHLEEDFENLVHIGHNRNEFGIEFMTPSYEGYHETEPLDLSKLCLDDELFDTLNEPEPNEDQVDEDRFGRGRSRSHSVHEYDNNNASFMPATEIGTASSKRNREIIPSAKSPSSLRNESKVERTGPLQQREVLALKQGLEEANQSINRYKSKEEEDDEEVTNLHSNNKISSFSLNHSSANSSSTTSSHGSPSDSSLRRIKILMLGDSGVGKSSLIMRWTMDTFSPSLTSTVGVNFKSRKVTTKSETVHVQVWDTAGQEQFHKITTSYYKGAHGIMLVYEVPEQKSLDNVEYWIRNIKSHASDSVQVALIGNKTDLRSNDPSKQCIDTEYGKEISVKFGIPFFETSAKDSSNVNDAFTTLVEHILDSMHPSKTPLMHLLPSKTSSHHHSYSHQGSMNTQNGHTASNQSSFSDKSSHQLEKSKVFGVFRKGVKNKSNSKMNASDKNEGTSPDDPAVGRTTSSNPAVGGDIDKDKNCLIS